MSNYLKATDFGSKDPLLSGDPNKIVKGTEINDEFDALQTAVNSKANTNNAALTGTPTAPTATAGTSTTQVATTAFVTTAISAVSLSDVYPVGSIYMNASVATNPGTLLGFGTWVSFGAGRVLLGEGDGYTAGETGGSKDAVVVSHTHTGSTNTAGNHSHSSTQSFLSNITTPGGIGTGGGDGGSFRGVTTTSAGSHSHTLTLDSTGSSGTNANLQPYVVVYMWQRTA